MALASPRASVWEWVQAGLLATNLAWTTLGLGGYRAETMVVTVALTGLLLIVHSVTRAMENSPPPLHPAGWWMLPFLVYALANVLWVTPARWLGWLDWIGWANLFAVFWVVLNGIRSRAPRQFVFLTLVALGLVAVLLACHQRFSRPDWLMLGRVQAGQFLGRASGPFGIPNSLAAFLLLLLPAVGALGFRRAASAMERVGWGWVGLVFAFGLLLTISRAAWLALALALTAWPLMFQRWSWRQRLVIAVVTLAGLLAAAVIVGSISPKVRERFAQFAHDAGERSRPILWRAAWSLFQENPVFGTGAGTFNVFFERHRPPQFRDEPQWAHNDYLNTLSDYGAVGFGLFAGAVVLVVARSRRRPRQSDDESRGWLARVTESRALGVGLLAFALHLFTEFHFKIPALAMSFAVIAVLALGASRATATDLAPAAKTGRFAWAAVAVLLLVAMFPALRLYRAEAWRAQAREALDVAAAKRDAAFGALLARVQTDFQRAAELDPANAKTWADLAFTFELQAFLTPARVKELAPSVEQAARRALALADVVPEFWIRLGVSLDMQRRFNEAEASFQRALALAPRNSHPWYYYAYHLSLDPKRRAQAREAIATCLALDPGNRAAETLREQLNDLP